MNRRLSYFFLGLGLFLLMTVPLLIILLPKGEAFYHVVISQKLLKEGNIDGALKQVTEAVNRRPENVIALRTAAKIYIVSGRYDDAEKITNELLETSAKSADLYRDIGLIQLYKGDIEDARAAAEQAIALSPESASNYHLLGAIALEEKDFETAEKQLKKATALAPEDAGSQYLLGSMYFDQERIPEAIEALSVVTKDEPEFAPAHSLLGLCYLKTNLRLHALTEFKQAVELNSSDYNSMYNIACIYSLMNNPDSAVKWLESAIDSGFKDFDHMREDADLDNIRANPEYVKLLERAPKNAASQSGTTGESIEKSNERRQDDTGTVPESAGDV
jgi:tetratricopeptide (TPR) repeat protein